MSTVVNYKKCIIQLLAFLIKTNTELPLKLPEVSSAEKNNEPLLYSILALTRHPIVSPSVWASSAFPVPKICLLSLW